MFLKSFFSMWNITKKRVWPLRTIHLSGAFKNKISPETFWAGLTCNKASMKVYIYTPKLQKFENS